MTLDEMVQLFSPDGLQKKAAIFDTKKLEWINGQHLSRMTAAELAPLVTPELIAANLATPQELERQADWYASLLELLKVRARTVHDVVRQAAPYFADEIPYDPDAVAKAWKDTVATGELLSAAHRRLTAVTDWTEAELERVLREMAEERGIAGGKLFQPLRVALTGMSVSPGIFEVLLAMGPKRAFKRLEQSVAHLKSLPGAG
jgi:glutamyl-tRNA synthetase